MERRIRGMIMGKTIRLFFGFLTIVFSVHRADAANLDVTPSILLGASWDSNIFNTESNEQTDYVFRGAPRLTFTVSSPTVRMDLTGAVEGEKYAEHDELDNADTTKSVDFRLVRTGPRLTFAPSVRFVETDDITRRNLGVPPDSPPPGPGVPTAESLITERIRTREYSGALQISYLLSRNVTLAVGGGALKRDFKENLSGLTDSRTVTGNGSFAYQFTPRTSGGIFFGTAYNSFDDRPNSRTYSGGVRGTYRASERTTVSASGGATFLRESAGVEDGVNEEWFPTGSLSLAYGSQDFRATLSGSYTVSGGGSFGRTTERGTVSLALTDRFSRAWSWDLSGSWQNNRSTGGQTGTEEDIDTASGTAGLRYQAASWASFRLFGNLYRQRSNTSIGRDLDRETVQLDMTLGNTFNLF